MQISRLGSNQIELKTRQGVVVADSQLRIGTVTIDGPGEYDVAGIAIQGLLGEGQTIYVLGMEDVRLCLVPEKPQRFNQALIEQMGSIDIAIVPVVGADTLADTVTLINDLEPNLVIPMGDSKAVEEFAKHSGVTSEPVTALKVTKSTLSPDERQTVILK